MKAPLILSPPLFMLALAGPVQGDMMGSSAASFGCEVRATKVHRGIRLEAVVSGETITSGEYDFAVRKSGGGGSSTTSQSGTFEVDAGEETILSEVTLGGGGTWTAELRVTMTSGGTCQARHPG